MRSRLIVAGVAILIAVVGVLVITKHRHAVPAREATVPPARQPSNPASSGGGTATQAPIHGERQLVSQILEQGLTPERAKLLFSMVVGDLPGVSVPEGSRNSADFDGTLAVSYISQVWDSLTPEQR